MQVFVSVHWSVTEGSCPIALVEEWCVPRFVKSKHCVAMRTALSFIFAVIHTKHFAICKLLTPLCTVLDGMKRLIQKELLLVLTKLLNVTQIAITDEKKKLKWYFLLFNSFFCWWESTLKCSILLFFVFPALLPVGFRLQCHRVHQEPHQATIATKATSYCPNCSRFCRIVLQRTPVLVQRDVLPGFRFRLFVLLSPWQRTVL